MNQNDSDEAILIAKHEADHDHSRFQPIVYRGKSWDLSHLNPFAFKVDIGDRYVFVVLLFSCHCFTHKIGNDNIKDIPEEELYRTHQETRVLNEERYNFSKTLLLQIVHQLHQRHITVADAGRNFVTLEEIGQNGEKTYYGVFFQVSKDKQRGGRIILRVQSAYPGLSLTNKWRSAKKVKFTTLIKAEYEGRKIRP